MSKRNNTFALLLLTLAALAVHGYHPYAEDAEIYLPGIKKLLHPALYPSGTEFFESHASLTFFPNLIAASVRLTHIPFDYAIFIWYLSSIFLLLLACWEFSGVCFDTITGAMGRGGVDRVAAYAAGRGDCSLPDGPISESTKSGGVCGGICRDPSSGKEICASLRVDHFCRGGASPDGVIRGGVLRSADLFRKITKARPAMAAVFPFANFFAPPIACLSRGHALSYFAFSAAMAVV